MKFCGVIGAFEPSSPHQTMKLLSWLDQGLWFGQAPANSVYLGRPILGATSGRGPCCHPALGTHLEGQPGLGRLGQLQSAKHEAAASSARSLTVSFELLQGSGGLVCRRPTLRRALFMKVPALRLQPPLLQVHQQ